MTNHIAHFGHMTQQCLTQLGHDLVCSGGHDLCLWDTNGALLDKFDRCTLPDTSQCMPLPLFRVM